MAVDTTCATKKLLIAAILEKKDDPILVQYVRILTIVFSHGMFSRFFGNFDVVNKGSIKATAVFIFSFA